MSSSGDGRSAGSTSGRGRSIDWPTPTMTGVRGSRFTTRSMTALTTWWLKVTGRVVFVRIAVGSDHAGFPLKSVIAEALSEQGFEVLDLGTFDASSAVDYPDFGEAVGRAVVDGRAELGVAICGSGVGISIAANKVPGVRAALVHDVTTARLAREHNHANVLCLGARIVGTQVALDAVSAWLTAPLGEGRHGPRVAKLDRLDEQFKHQRKD